MLLRTYFRRQSDNDFDIATLVIVGEYLTLSVAQVMRSSYDDHSIGVTLGSKQLPDRQAVADTSESSGLLAELHE